MIGPVDLVIITSVCVVIIIYTSKSKNDNNQKLIKNIEEYEQKEKVKQQESKVLGQKPVKRKANQEKNTVHNSQRL